MKLSTVIAALLLAMGSSAFAQSVALQGMLGKKALLIVDGSAPKTVAPGETFMGVKVVSTTRDEAVVEIDGRRETLRVGEAPASVGASGTRSATAIGQKVIITAAAGGQFITDGRINNQQVRMMVDTGAASVAMSESEAKRLGLEYKTSTPSIASTANGNVVTWSAKLASVRVGDIEVRDVEASVITGGADMPYVVLGNSFLGRFQVKRENDQMILERRY